MHDNTVPATAVTNSFADGIGELGRKTENGSECARSAAFAERVRMSVLTLENAVESRTQVLGGAPVLKGTRFSVGQLFAELAEGENIDTVAVEFELDREALSALLHALAVYLCEQTAP